MKIIPAETTLKTLRDGQVMAEMAQAIHEAMAAVDHLRKPATINLCLTIKPFGTDGVSDAVGIVAKVTKKLPQAEQPCTLFFADADGNPTRQREKQPDIPGLSIAGQPNAA
jgi:hypothetical protein